MTGDVAPEAVREYVKRWEGDIYVPSRSGGAVPYAGLPADEKARILEIWCGLGDFPLRIVRRVEVQDSATTNSVQEGGA